MMAHTPGENVIMTMLQQVLMSMECLHHRFDTLMTNELLGMHAAGTNISEHGSDVLPVKTDAERTQELLAKT